MPIIGTIASSRRAFTIEGSMEPIAVATVPSGGISSITFGSIPQTYTHLQIRFMAKGDNAGDLEYLGFRFNGFTGNYWWHQFYGDGSSVVATNFQQSFMRTFIAGNTGTNMFGVGVSDILDYTNTNKNKVIRTLSGYDLNGQGAVTLASGLWTDTSAITSITLLGVNNLLKAGSTFALYGIKGA